jgi:vesicular inhibitory amino acid transporter
MAGKAWFTLEDAKIAFNLFCCVYGIGTLGMPANFSRAGPAIAVFALVFMAFANIYSSVVCSKVLLTAPRSVKTFGDLGEFCMGKPGRYLVVISQMGVCLLVPCAFLVLGGILLDSLFPGAFQPSVWIILMALSVLPVCLIPTLKEGAGAAFAGCLGTIIADVIGVGVLLHGMNGHPSIPSPAISFKQVATTFGNLSLAYGAGIVIPALQRQHSDPTRMPRVAPFSSCRSSTAGKPKRSRRWCATRRSTRSAGGWSTSTSCASI